MKNNQTAMGTLGADISSQNQMAPAMESAPPNQMGAVKKVPPVPAITAPKMAKGKPVMKKKIRSIQDLKDAGTAMRTKVGRLPGDQQNDGGKE